MRHGGQILVDQLEIQGVDRVFCVPGESYLAALDGLFDSNIETIIGRQEGGVGDAGARRQGGGAHARAVPRLEARRERGCRRGAGRGRGDPLGGGGALRRGDDVI